MVLLFARIRAKKFKSRSTVIWDSGTPYCPLPNHHVMLRDDVTFWRRRKARTKHTRKYRTRVIERGKNECKFHCQKWIDICILKICVVCIYFKSSDVEAVEYFLLPLLAPYKVSRFRICFRLHPCPMFYEKCFRFRLLKKSNASEFASVYTKI